MSKLISANIMRLKKNKLFWCSIIFMFLFAALLVLNQYRMHIQHGAAVSIESVFFIYALFIGILMAVFSSLYLGTEYSDGTIRNKLIIGHTRLEIYFSNLITNIAVSFLLCIIFMISAMAFGIPLIGFFTLDTKIVLLILLGTFFLAVVFSSIFTLISMICANKSSVAVISILLVVVFLILASYLQSRLDEPEFYDAALFTSAGVFSETMVSTENGMQVPNPLFLEGTARDVVQFFYDFLPTGQSIQYSCLSVLHLWLLPLYSILITISTTVIGAAAFQKKDLK